MWSSAWSVWASQAGTARYGLVWSGVDAGADVELRLRWLLFGVS